MRRLPRGVPRQVYGSIVPGAAAIARLLPQQANEVKSGKSRPLSKETRERYRKIQWYEEHGRRVRLTCRHFGISSSTFYKWLRRYQCVGPASLEERSRRPRRVRQPSWGHELVQAVQQLRERHPRWGKDKLAPMLRAAGWECSTSKVGRIIAALKKQGMLVEAPLADPWRVSHPHKRPHAVRKPRDYIVSDPGVTWCRSTRLTSVPSLASSASTSQLAKADFETFCQQQEIRLFVLPPRSPKLNGSVERAQRTHREEFYNVIDWPDSIAELRRMLRRQEIVYNTIRPHQSLGYLTPLAFLQGHSKQKTARDPVATARLPFYTQHLSTERRSV